MTIINFVFLIVAALFWLAGILHMRQVTLIERTWSQWATSIWLLLWAILFTIGAFLG